MFTLPTRVLHYYPILSVLGYVSGVSACWGYVCTRTYSHEHQYLCSLCDVYVCTSAQYQAT